MLIRIIAILATVFLAGTSTASQRVALVIGVSDYDNAPDLANPVRDAEAVSDALTAIGFEVQLSLDPNQRTFGQELLTFVERANGADAALFYFAGHGIQINSKNYLLSKTAAVQNPLLIDQDGFDLSKILDLVSANAATTIAIVDACRDNPMAEALHASSAPATRSAWGLSRGLARMERDFSNSLVAFATAPGRVAFDGAGRHSPFTQAFLKHIASPDLEVSVMLKRVTRDVLEDTDGAQRPEIVASMAQEFYFYKPTINFEGDIVLPGANSDEVAATRLLRIALELPEGDRRNSSLSFIKDRYDGTDAAAFAEQFLKNAEKSASATETLKPQSAPVATEDPPKAFDTARLEGLDLDRLKQEAEQSQVSEPTPEEVEAALGLADADITRIQTALNSLGYDLGGVDGAFGPRSRRALRSFQVVSRLPETGYLDEPTIDALLKTVAETPKTYDGEWQLIIYREWLRDDPGHAPNKRGTREVLTSATLSARNNRFYIQSFHYRTISPNDAYEDFEATYNDDGLVRIAGGVSTMFRNAQFVVPQMQRLSASFRLPALMPYRKSVEASANRIDGNLRFHVKLTRIK